MKVAIYSDNKIVEKSGYINSIDTLKNYPLERDFRSGNKSIKVKQFFQPLRNGEWSFIEPKKKLHTTKKYQNGIEIIK